MPSAPAPDWTEARALQRLALELLDDGPDLPMPSAAAAPIPPAIGAEHGLAATKLTLRLDDMVGDGNGEVVLLNDAGLTHLAIATDADVVSQGVALDHTVATGEDVSGFAYVAFATGLTLYYPEGVDVAVLPQG
jgi:hypothetical protein